MAVRCCAAGVLLAMVAGVVRAAPVPLVSVGDPSPLGLPFSRFSEPAIDDGGRVAFVGGSTAIFKRTPAGIARIVGAGDVIAGRTLAGVDAPWLAAGDCLAFRALVVGGGSIIVRRCGTDVVILAEIGDLAPGGARFASFGQDVVIGSGGRVVFTALLEGGAMALYETLGNRVFFEIVRTGSPSPAGGQYTSFRPVGISPSGGVGFRGAVTSGPDGLFHWTGSGLAKLAVVGDGTPAGGSYTAVGLASMNLAGTWAFRATVSGDVGGGVFRADATSSVPAVRTVVLRGDPTPLDGTFADFPTSLVPSINEAGAVAFRATVSEGEANSGVFLASPSGELSTVVAIRTAVDEQPLARLREVVLAGDGGVVVRATQANGRPGLFLAREGAAQALALLGDATDLGAGFRFSDATVHEVAGDAAFLGVAEGVFVGTSAADLGAIAVLGEPTPLRGTYAAVDPPAAGDGGRIVFGAGIQSGRAGEALLTLGRKRLKPTVKTGSRVRRAGRLIDLFFDPLDDLSRPGVGRGGIAFQSALSGSSAGTGVFSKGTTGRTRALAVAGDRAPGGGRYELFGTPAVVSARRVAFVAELSDPVTRALILRRGRRHVLVARAGQDTVTRLGGRFFTFDTPSAGAGGIAFRATLQDRREGIFFARGERIVALAATAETDPGGGRFRAFGLPTVAGEDVIVHAQVVNGTIPGGLYRITTTDPIAITPLASAGSPSPLGGTFLAFGTPSSNRRGAIAYTADLLNASTPTTIIIDNPN